MSFETLKNGLALCSMSAKDCASVHITGDNCYCIALQDTSFKNKACPFYKTKDLNDAERTEIIQDLVKKGRLDVLDRYYGRRQVAKILEGVI